MAHQWRCPNKHFWVTGDPIAGEALPKCPFCQQPPLQEKLPGQPRASGMTTAFVGKPSAQPAAAEETVNLPAAPSAVPAAPISSAALSPSDVTIDRPPPSNVPLTALLKASPTSTRQMSPASPGDDLCLRTGEFNDTAENASSSETIVKPGAGANDTDFDLTRDDGVIYPQVAGYEILGVLGRGGMGVVYKARQTGLNRIAALKMILGGAHASSADRIRFRTEAEAIAKLQHPNIVQVYDIGVHDGLPYFSLEYLDGGSLAGKLDGGPLAPREAAAIVQILANGMQHAHEHGIVHRDLKPANILIQSYDAATQNLKAHTTRGGSQSSIGATMIGSSLGNLKITDFGLAKRITDDSGLTGTGTILGTPSYMAPEQADGRINEIGACTDIYALGAMLYELLTGRPPFRGTTPTDTILQVRLLDPIPPRRWVPKTPPDLETICLKCLEKLPSKRYHTAGDLADELRRFLNGEPIVARPAPFYVHAWKWAVRHPSAAGLVGLSACVLLTMIGGSLAFARYASNKAATEHSLRETAEAEWKRAEAERLRAEDNFRSARAAVDQMLVRVGERKLEHEPRMERLRQELLNDAVVFLDRFVKEQSSDRTVRMDAGRAYLSLGRVREMLGQFNPALEAYRHSEELHEKLTKEFPDKPEHAEDLVLSQRALATALLAAKQHKEAEAAFNRASELQEALAKKEPEKAAHRLNLGQLLNDRGIQLMSRDATAADESFRRSAEQFELIKASGKATPLTELELAKSRINRSTVLVTLGRLSEARALINSAMDILKQQVAANPDDPRFPRELGRAVLNFGGALQTSKETITEADKVFADAAVMFHELADKFPATPDYRYFEAMAHHQHAIILKTIKSPRAAEADLRRAGELYAKLVQDHPGNLDYRKQYSQCLEEFAIYLNANRETPVAIQAARESLEQQKKLTADDPQQPDLKRLLAMRHLNLGMLLTADQQNVEAEKEYDKAVALLDELVTRLPGATAYKRDLTAVLINRGNLLAYQGQAREADKNWRQVAEYYNGLSIEQPGDASVKMALAGIWYKIAKLYPSDPKQSIPAFRAALPAQSAAVTKLAGDPRRLAAVDLLGQITLDLADALLLKEDYVEASAVIDQLGPSLPEDWRSMPRAAAIVAQCAGLAGKDEGKPTQDREALAAGYRRQSMSLLERAIRGGYRDAESLKTSSAYEPLRSGSDKAAWDQLLEQISTNAAKKP